MDMWKNDWQSRLRSEENISKRTEWGVIDLSEASLRIDEVEKTIRAVYPVVRFVVVQVVRGDFVFGLLSPSRETIWPMRSPWDMN